MQLRKHTVAVALTPNLSGNQFSRVLREHTEDWRKQGLNVKSRASEHAIKTGFPGLEGHVCNVQFVQ